MARLFGFGYRRRFRRARAAAGGGGGGGGGDEFFATDGASQPFNNGINPVALFNSGSSTTWFGYDAVNVNVGQRMMHVTSYDHSSGGWGNIEAAGINPLVANEHGPPVLLVDHQGHRHAFGGSHNSDIRHSSTRTNGSWAFRGVIAGVYTYPHVAIVGSTIYLIMREASSTTRGKLVLRKTTWLDGGDAAWQPSDTVLVDLGADSHVYISDMIVHGSKLHMVGVRANGDKSVRKDVDYYVYDPATGNVENHDGSTVVLAANLPVDLTTANSDFRLVETVGESYVPTLCFDTNGDPHVVYSDGTRGGSFDLRHIVRVSGSWSSPVTVDTTNAATYPFQALVPLSGGEVALYWEEDDAAAYPRGGNIARTIRSSGGTWGSPTTIKEPDRAYAVARPTQVRDGHNNAQIVFCEISATTDGTGTEDDLRSFAYGLGGFLTRPTQGTTPVVASMIFDASDRGVGTDANFGSVVMLADFSVGE